MAILDEAHTFEAVASQHLGLQISSLGVDFRLARLYNERNGKGLLGIKELTDAIDQLKRTRAARPRISSPELKTGIIANRQILTAGCAARSAIPEILPEELRRLASAIHEGAQKFERPEERIELDAAELRCRALAAEISAWTRQTESANVYWVELEHKSHTRIKLASAPLDVGPRLRSLLFDKVPTCVLTSATICVGSPPKFDFIKSRLGLTRAETVALGSPFDYAHQVTVHLPKNLPDPADQSVLFEQRAIRAIAHYLEQTQGKAFVLFTSYKMLDAAARALTPWLLRRNIALFAQSDGMPRSKMVEAFKADVNSVIFGADTFWQGVDVPGEALSNVIITRLPFSVPSHPLLEARLEDIRQRGGSPFVEYQVPEAVIKLKQGFGRLIRTKTDRGIVVILDPRVLTKPYGRTFLNSLPRCPQIVETPAFSDHE